MTTPVLETNYWVGYYRCDRDPTSTESSPPVYTNLPNFLIPWWNQTSGDVFLCINNTLNAMQWNKLITSSNISNYVPSLPVSLSNGGTGVNASVYSANSIIFQNSSNNGFNTSPNLTFASNVLTVGGDVSVSSGNLSIGTSGKGINIKSSAVSAGTANTFFITGVTLVAGTATISNSVVNTSCTANFTVTSSGGTPGTGYRIVVGTGTLTVTSSSALDTSTGNISIIKGF